MIWKCARCAFNWNEEKDRGKKEQPRQITTIIRRQTISAIWFYGNDMKYLWVSQKISKCNFRWLHNQLGIDLSNERLNWTCWSFSTFDNLLCALNITDAVHNRHFLRDKAQKGILFMLLPKPFHINRFGPLIITHKIDIFWLGGEN